VPGGAAKSTPAGKALKPRSDAHACERDVIFDEFHGLSAGNRNDTSRHGDCRSPSAQPSRTEADHRNRAFTGKHPQLAARRRPEGVPRPSLVTSCSSST